MSEEVTQDTKEAGDSQVKLNGIYAFKQGMSSIYDDQGNLIPVTVLKVEPLVVSQLKTKEKDGYEAVQVAFKKKKATRTVAAQKGHLAKAGFENGAQFIREVKQSLPAGIEVGQAVSIDSLMKGDFLKVTGKSKGRGFAGVMKRWDFGGGRASHGSGTHRRTGSIGNCEFPGRVMPGKKMPGHFGVDTVSVKNVKVIDILPEEGVILVKGPVPGAKNSLVQMVKA